MAAIEAANPALNAVVNIFDSQGRQAIAGGLPSGDFGASSSKGPIPGSTGWRRR